MRNPLAYNPWNNYELDLEADSFPHVFQQIYGDSVSIQFRQATYSLPWSDYQPQMIKSELITVSTAKIIENWRNGRYEPFPEREPTMEEYFGLKAMRPH